MRLSSHLRSLIEKLRSSPGSDDKLVGSFDERFITIAGHRFFHDRRSLLELIEMVPSRKRMAEIGSLAGFSTRLFQQHFEKVYSVDPYAPGYDPADGNSSRSRLGVARDIFTIRFFDDPAVAQYNEPSSTACDRFEPRSLDFVYIDGDHTVAGVLKDIDSWRPKVIDGGFMAGDDLDRPSVREAVRSRFTDYKEIASRWIVQLG